MPYLSALEVWSRQGAIQIHVYHYLSHGHYRFDSRWDIYKSFVPSRRASSKCCSSSQKTSTVQVGMSVPQTRENPTALKGVFCGIVYLCVVKSDYWKDCYDVLFVFIVQRSKFWLWCVTAGTADIARVTIESHCRVTGTHTKLGSRCWHRQRL